MLYISDKYKLEIAVKIIVYLNLRYQAFFLK